MAFFGSDWLIEKYMYILFTIINKHKTYIMKKKDMFSPYTDN